MPIIKTKANGAKKVSISAIQVFLSRSPAKSYIRFIADGIKEPCPAPIEIKTPYTQNILAAFIANTTAKR